MMNVRQMENAILKRIIQDALAEGFRLKVVYGKDQSCATTSNADSVYQNIHHYPKETLMMFHDTKYYKFCYVNLVYGGDGYDVVKEFYPPDYTLWNGVKRLAEELENQTLRPMQYKAKGDVW